MCVWPLVSGYGGGNMVTDWSSLVFSLSEDVSLHDRVVCVCMLSLSVCVNVNSCYYPCIACRFSIIKSLAKNGKELLPQKHCS